MEGIVYITLEQAKDIHAKTIQYSGGGTLGHFDLGRLESVLVNIQNDDYYPTFVDKITHLFTAPVNYTAYRMEINVWLLHYPHTSCFLMDTWRWRRIFFQ